MNVIHIDAETADKLRYLTSAMRSTERIHGLSDEGCVSAYVKMLIDGAWHDAKGRWVPAREYFGRSRSAK